MSDRMKKDITNCDSMEKDLATMKMLRDTDAQAKKYAKEAKAKRDKK